MIYITISEMGELFCQALCSLIDSQSDFSLLNEEHENKRRAQLSKREAQSNTTSLVHICKFNEDKPDEALQTLEQTIENKHPKGTLVLLDSNDLQLRNRIMKLGSTSIARTDAKKNELVALIRASAAGYTSSPPETALAKAIGALTPQENTIARLACRGYSRKELAAELALSESSIKRSVSRILATTGYATVNKLALDAISEKAVNPHLNIERASLIAEPHERDIRYYHACDR